MNFKKHPYPTVEEILTESRSIALEFDKQLDPNYKDKILLRDIYMKQGFKCSSNRNLLRSKFHCNSTNAKYPNKEIKGVYVFVNTDENKPFYVGISQTIIRRLKQHVFGKLNTHATLAYLIARDEYERLENKPYTGTRPELTYFDRHRDEIQERLRSSRILIKEVDNNFLLHSVEVYLTCHLKTYWNCFETH
jgi:hypothetical protein